MSFLPGSNLSLRSTFNNAGGGVNTTINKISDLKELVYYDTNYTQFIVPKTNILVSNFFGKKFQASIPSYNGTIANQSYTYAVNNGFGTNVANGYVQLINITYTTSTGSSIYTLTFTMRGDTSGDTGGLNGTETAVALEHSLDNINYIQDSRTTSGGETISYTYSSTTNSGKIYARLHSQLYTTARVYSGGRRVTGYFSIDPTTLSSATPKVIYTYVSG